MPQAVFKEPCIGQHVLPALAVSFTFARRYKIWNRDNLLRMSSSSHSSKRSPVAAGVVACASTADARKVLVGDAKAAVARSLKKMAVDSNAALFKAAAAQTAFGKIRRASR